ncbi:MAG: 4-(cytidine 5'-diphospho)-2-C-methyl-D-erythritol kinase [Clostridia bacterium]|nr:4-(cytidine 5'-diphospho)-2-C-methyl-D-erythritol kinase [Clostridia bacterium]
MLINAYAKINLTLDITRKRSDGYHDISTVMQSISLCDELELTKNKDGKIKISCNKRGVPTDERNSAYKAAKAIMEYCGITEMGVNIFINKSIPVEAGMGGGSADAAAVLLGMNKLFDLQLTDGILVDIAAGIGADVPFCLLGGTRRCEGIGDVMMEVPPIPECFILICKPPVGVSTALAYSESDKYPQDGSFMTPLMVDALSTGDINKVVEAIGNRFDDILQIPDVQIIKSLMDEYGALGSCMTGSGSAVFGIFKDELKVKEAYEILKPYGDVFITRPMNKQ